MYIFICNEPKNERDTISDMHQQISLLYGMIDWRRGMNFTVSTPQPIQYQPEILLSSFSFSSSAA